MTNAHARGIERDEHIANCVWAESAQEVISDVAHLIWNAYGVSSSIGRTAERFYRRSGGLWPALELRAHAFDESIHDAALRPSDASRRGVRGLTFAGRRQNRFSFERVGFGRRPHAMSVELRAQATEELNALARSATQLQAVYASAYGRGDHSAKVLRDVAAFALRLNDLFAEKRRAEFH